MCPKPTHAATLAVALMAAAIAQPALAWPFGAPAAKPAATAPATPAAAPDPSKVKASPAERAKADQLDMLSRIAFWTRENTLDPTDEQAGVELAKALRLVGRNDEAGDTAARTLGMHPKSVPAMFEVARSRISANKGFYAIQPLKDAAAADPHDGRPWALLGVAYEQNEQPDLAQVAYEQALKLTPNDPAALSNYALFRATHGEPQLAEGLLRKAVAQPGAGAAQRQNLALVLGLEGKMGEAERLIRQDLPPEAADADLAYLRAINAGQAKIQPVAGAAPHGLSAVQASEVAQTRAPS